MSDPTPDQLREAGLILAGAMAAAGKMESSVAWKGRVNSLIPMVGAMFGERSTQMQRALHMLNAAVFTAELDGFTIEESSNRIVVHLKHPVDKDHPDGLEHLRTERLESLAGKIMAEKLGRLQPGVTLLCWKVMEDIKSGPNAGRQVRVLYHIEDFPDRKDSAPKAQGGGPAVRSAPEEQQAGPSSGAPPQVATDTIGLAEFEAFNLATEHLPGRVKAGFVASLREQNLWPPSPNNIDDILNEAKQVKA